MSLRSVKKAYFCVVFLLALIIISLQFKDPKNFHKPSTTWTIGDIIKSRKVTLEIQSEEQAVPLLIKSKQDLNLAKNRSESRLLCPALPIVAGTDGGRLGNKIWEYAAVWSLAQLLGRPGYVPQSLLASLNKVFAKLSLFPLESISHCNVSLGEPFHRSQLLPINKLKEKLKNQNLLLMPWILMPEPVMLYRKSLAGEFIYRSDIVRQVKETIRELGGEGKVLIGIHVRRTDFVTFLPKYFKTTLVAEQFFLEAMDWYRTIIAGHLLFLIVSDDLKWCKDNLMIFNDTVIASKSPEHDLVLLSTCDHRIIDYGTFGYWGALMGGGHTISLNVDKAFNKAMVSKIEKWHLLEPSKYSRSNTLHEMANSSKKTENLHQRSCPTLPIVAATDGGQLGDRIWEYAAVWSLAQHLERPGFVPQSMLTSLDKVFTNLSLSSLESISHCKISLGQPFLRKQLLPIDDLGTRLENQNLLLVPKIVMPEPVLEYQYRIASEFSFRPELLLQVRDTIREVGGEGKVVIGVNVHRNDFGKFNNNLPGKDFYLDAMDWFRNNIAGPMMFLIVSDDLKWCRDNLLELDDVTIASKSHLHDLVLLSTCDHTIIDVGTIGYWGALMAGGTTISLNVDKDVNDAMSVIETWHLINRSNLSSFEEAV